METIQGISQFNSTLPTVMTIGTFDGVHIGHQSILKRLINSAKTMGLRSAVLTFFPHPRMVLQKDADIKLLNTLEEKKAILADLGIDYLIVHPFTKEFSRLSAMEFVRDNLVNQLKVKKVIIGYDHRFGRNRNASIHELRNFGTTFDFEVEEIPAQEIDEVSISSTKIRNALMDGRVDVANTYLGYTYMLNGTITRGKGLGKQIGFPTANLYIAEQHKLIPQNGVYVVRSEIDGQVVNGMMNIGLNPTVAGDKRSIEVHYFDIDQDLYDTKVQVRLIKKIRDERKFDSLEALREQLRKDQATSMNLISDERY
ncbi:bifunctional riboflavin kinase/FAD synthetase [Flagellimonas sp. DF-77]|uniref:bifunctional riboflavin kinase/FAD synthetase n=1 Tax=Flagellimonas algarum TaxID=3230298 RepID=UPI003398B760